MTVGAKVWRSQSRSPEPGSAVDGWPEGREALAWPPGSSREAWGRFPIPLPWLISSFSAVSPRLFLGICSLFKCFKHTGPSTCAPRAAEPG